MKWVRTDEMVGLDAGIVFRQSFIGFSFVILHRSDAEEEKSWTKLGHVSLLVEICEAYMRVEKVGQQVNSRSVFVLLEGGGGRCEAL